jgi:hypothetical protein
MLAPAFARPKAKNCNQEKPGSSISFYASSSRKKEEENLNRAST